MSMPEPRVAIAGNTPIPGQYGMVNIDELMSIDGQARMEFDIWRMKEILRFEQEEIDNCHPVLAGVMDE